MPTIQPKDPREIGPDARAKQHTVTLPIWLWKKIDELGATLGYERNETIREVLKSWTEEMDAKATSSKKSGSK